MSQLTYPSGRILAITRNSVGQVTGVTMKKNATAAVENVATAISFQPLSDQLATLTHGNGLVSNAVYDLDGRLTQLQVKNGAVLVSGFGLAYADNLNLTGITDQVTAANSNILAYTPANRLASATGVWGNKAYTYDGVGNRITDVTTGGTSVSRSQYYSNTSNRLNDIWENGAQLRVYTHDGAGNTLTETRPGEAFAYTYNKRNRLSSVTRNGSLWGTYVYNAFEQLVSRTSPAPAAPLGTVHYIHDLDGHLIAEADGATGAVLRDYIWLPANDNEVQDLPLAVIDGVNTATPVTSFIHTDHLGRPTRMTNAAKATVWHAVWTPWGEAQSMTGSVTNNLRFPGQYFQIETNLHYNHHRQYDPVTGRYTQPDPLGFVDGPSVYAYAGNSPWMNVDRSGRFFRKLPGIPPGGYVSSSGAGGMCTIGPLIGGGFPASGGQSYLHLTGGSRDQDDDGLPDEIDEDDDGIDILPIQPGKETFDGFKIFNPAPIGIPGLGIGKFGQGGIPARGPGRDFTADERAAINALGYKNGCHSCGSKNPGTKSGNFVLDHQPPTAMNPQGGRQLLFPHCLTCSLRQGGMIRNMTRE